MLKAQAVSKRYSGQVVLQGVDFSLEAGEIVLLAGPNGAGKSTLARILAGFDRPDEGTVTLNGRQLRSGNPNRARSAGIWLVPQEPPLVEALSVTDNCRLLSRNPSGIDSVCQKLGVDFVRSHPAARLPYKHMYLLALVAAMASDPSVLILDETLGALDPLLVNRVVGAIEEKASQGKSVLVISHRFSDIASHCTRIVHLHEGRIVQRLPTPLPDASPQSFHMTKINEASDSPTNSGSDLRQLARIKSRLEETEPLFEIATTSGANCSSFETADRSRLVEAREGEIVCVSGDRRRSIVRALRAKSATASGITVRTRGSFALVPHDYDSSSLFPSLSVRDNLLLVSGRSKREIDSFYERYAKQLRLAASPDARVGDLSGGTRQKVAIVCALVTEPAILVLEEPFHSLDLASRRAFLETLQSVAQSGVAVVVVTDDQELLEGVCRVTIRME